MPLEVVRGFTLQRVTAVDPLSEKQVQLLEFDEQMRRFFEHRGRPAECALGINQFGGGIGVSADTVVTGLIGAFAFGAGAADEPICQEGAGFRIVQLFDWSFDDQIGIAESLPELAAELAIGNAVGAAVMIEFDIKTSEISLVNFAHQSDQLFFAATLLAGPNHDCGSVRIVGADVDAAIATKLLEADPNVGLNVLHQMTDMDRTVGVGQSTGDQDLSCHGTRLWCRRLARIPEVAALDPPAGLITAVTFRYQAAG